MNRFFLISIALIIFNSCSSSQTREDNLFKLPVSKEKIFYIELKNSEEKKLLDDTQKVDSIIEKVINSKVKFVKFASSNEFVFRDKNKNELFVLMYDDKYFKYKGKTYEW